MSNQKYSSEPHNKNINKTKNKIYDIIRSYIMGISVRVR